MKYVKILAETIEQLETKLEKGEKDLKKLKEKVEVALNKLKKKYPTWFKNPNYDKMPLNDQPRELQDDFFDFSQLERKVSDKQESINKLKEKINKQKVRQEKTNTKQSKLNSIPKVFIPFIETLVKNWDSFDIKRRNKLKKLGDNYYKIDGKIDYKKFNEYEEYVHLSDEQIHKDNERAANNLIINLIERIQEKVGTVKSYSNLHVTNGNAWRDNGTAINGFVEGEKGKVNVDSIIAGGYNIQRLHVRVLVKKL